jgi:pseudouridine kinase
LDQAGAAAVSRSGRPSRRPERDGIAPASRAGGAAGEEAPRILCIGAAAIDRKYRALAPLRADTSNPVASDRAAGGVARNVAENLARLGVATALVSLVGDDTNGRWLREGLQALGIGTAGLRVAPGRSTAEYVAVLEPDGTLAFGLADMAIFDALSPEHVDAAPGLDGAAWILADCNLPAPVLRHLLGRQAPSARLAVDAVSVAKVARLPADLTGLDLLFLNEAEAAAVLGTELAPDAAAARLRERGAAAVVLTCGAAGLAAAGPAGVVRVPAQAGPVVDVTGAGDALIAATLHRLLAGDALADAARWGAASAALTVASVASVRPDLSPDLLAGALAVAPRSR